MNTSERKGLPLPGSASLAEDGSRKAAGAVQWFSEAIDIAFDGLIKARGALMEMHQNSGLLILRESLQPKWNKSIKAWHFFY